MGRGLSSGRIAAQSRPPRAPSNGTACCSACVMSQLSAHGCYSKFCKKVYNIWVRGLLTWPSPRQDTKERNMETLELILDILLHNHSVPVQL
eukprot:4542369-Amphidinium_carterae.1